MGFLVRLKFAVKCFDILAWPLLSLGYPLLSFWPYVKLMVIVWLVVHHFDGSLYVYENLVRPCFSVNPLVVIERCNKRKEKLFLERENFLVAAEIYLKENGPEALEKLISGKLKYKEPNVAQKEIEVVEVTVKKELAAEKRVNQTVPNLPQTENQSFTASGTKETVATTAAAAGSDSKLPEIPASKEVQKEWACALCQVITQSETTWHSHLRGARHGAAYEELMSKNCAAKNKGSPASTAKKSYQPKVDTTKCVPSSSSNQKNIGQGEEKVEVLKKQKPPSRTDVTIKQSKLWCDICNVGCTGEINMNSHLNGKRHFARMQELGGYAGSGLGRRRSSSSSIGSGGIVAIQNQSPTHHMCRKRI